MKYGQRFNSLADASGFIINDTPFACTIQNGLNVYDTINLHTNKDSKIIKVENNNAQIDDGPLMFKSYGLTTISLTNNDNNMPDMKYSLDGGETWAQWDYSAISLNDGNIIYFKGNNPNGFSSSYQKYSKFVFGGTGTIEAHGNIMSLIDDGLCQTLTIPCNYCYYYMFQNCSSLTSAPELPATTLASYCYSYMFYGCTSLTSAPELPATTLADYCYYYMFQNCTSLTSAPELPATILADYCYMFMFWNCTSLTSAPELPATTLTDNCYQYMFYGCTSLTSAPELPATTLTDWCYYYMFCGCTSLSSAPELPATTLASGCYNGMFYGCTNLNYIKCLATSGINIDNSTSGWVSNVKSSGTFVKASSASWPTGNNGIPSGWTVQTT